MVDFVNKYNEPGIYVEEVPSPIAVLTGIAPSVTAIVGPSIGYRTHTEAVTLEGTTPVTLAKMGIDQGEVVVKSSDNTTYLTTIDYVLAEVAGDDGDLGETLDNTTTLTRVDDGNITDSSVVFVTYQYTDEAYFDPQRFLDYDDIVDFYGAPFNSSTGALQSHLSLAAKLALDNGANEIVCLAVEILGGAVAKADLASAYPKLNAHDDISVVVPLPVGVTGTEVAPGDTVGIGTDLATHVATASASGLRRIGILGFDPAVTVDPDGMAEAISDSRVVYVYPNKVLYYNGTLNQVTDLGAQYLAAAISGVLMRNNPEQPLTKKYVRGFEGVSPSLVSSMTKQNKNTWSEAGVCVVEPRDGRLQVRHGTSTDPTNIQTREISLTRAKDSLVLLVEQSLDRSGMIGSPIYDDTPVQIKGVVSGALETAKSQGLIVDYINLKARQQSTDPSVMEIKFQYRPAYPLNYVVVSYSINTETGAISEQEAA